MATRTPRVGVTLSEEARDVVQRLAAIEGTSASKVISGIVEDFLPVAKQLLELGEAAKNLTDAQKAQMAELAASMESGVVPQSQAVLEAFKANLATAKGIVSK